MTKMKRFKRRLNYYKAYLAYFTVATAQFLCPSAAADPASKISPPEWSYREVQEEIKAYEMQEIAKEPDEADDLLIQEKAKDDIGAVVLLQPSGNRSNT